VSGEVRIDSGAVRELLNSPEGPVAAEILKRGIRVERVAKKLCPVDTGRLRASITHALGRDSQSVYCDVGTDVVYAPYVEFGTSRQAAQPYLRPALGAADE
jgi:HK97 gp10 family phage protein